MVDENMQKNVEDNTTTVRVSKTVRDAFRDALGKKPMIEGTEAVMMWYVNADDSLRAAMLQSNPSVFLQRIDRQEAEIQKLKNAINVHSPQGKYTTSEASSAEAEIAELKYRMAILEGLYRSLDAEKTMQAARQTKKKGAG